MKRMTWIGLIFLEVLSLVFLLPAINDKITIYPFLGDPDMPAWQNVIRPANLYISIVISALGCIFSGLLLLLYSRLWKRRKKISRQFEWLLCGLMLLPVIKTGFLIYHFCQLFQIALSIVPCDPKVTHILCTDIR
jgi:ABC-type spermidine/putrescine transport system permease subunit II